MATAVGVGATGNSEIDGLLSGIRWSGSITFSFPDSPSDYPSSGYSVDNEPWQTGFAQAPAAMQAAINYAVSLIQGYTNINISYAGTNAADIQIAQSPAANPTSYAYYPWTSVSGGDIWFGTAYNYSAAKLGNYFFATALHELGHALGLKHSQETGGPANVAVPYAHDNSEYSIMSYRSYAGAPLTGYTAETYGFSQTYMANDILALQTMYGANYNTHSENTTYTWNATTGQMFINGVGQLAPGGGVGGSANRVFETIWDGNGIDTYDLSNYTTSVSINLNPGASSITSAAQLAYLGNGHYAAGNIYNSYLFGSDPRSYIENAIGGSAGDTIVGNAIANNLNGGGGNDTITGGGGNDTIVGGSGTDTAVYSGNKSNYLITYNSGTQTFTIVDQRGSSPDGTDTVTGVENFQFADGTFAASTMTGPPNLSAQVYPGSSSAAAGSSVSVSTFVINYGGGNAGASNTRIYLSTDPNITTSDTVLATISSGALAAVKQSGYYDKQTVSITLPGNLTSGTYYIGAIADYDNQIAESDETDNAYNVAQITVTGGAPTPPAPIPPPNLSAQVYPGSSSAAAGSSVSVSTFVINYGGGNAGASNTRIYLSTDPNITTSDAVLATISSGALAAVKQSGYYDKQTVSVALPGNLTSGTYYIGAIADYDNQIAESDETDNAYNVAQITVTGGAPTPPAPIPPPNLSAQVYPGSSSAVAGSSVSVSTFVVNYGSVSAVGSNTRIYLSTDPNITTSDTVLATISSGALAAVKQSGYYDKQTVSITLPGNLTSGTYYIGAIADYDNQIAESDETDNTYNVAQITVTATSASTPSFGTMIASAPTNTAPSTPIGHDQNVASGTSVALSTLFTGLTDLDSGDSVTHVLVSDRSAGGGHLTKNGVVQHDNQTYGPIPISQLSQWAFLTGGTDTIAFQTVDSHGAFSATAFATVTAIEAVLPTANVFFDGSVGIPSVFMNLEQSAFEFGQYPELQGSDPIGLHDTVLGLLFDHSIAGDVRSVFDAALEHLPAAPPEIDTTVQKVLAAHFDQFLFH